MKILLADDEHTSRKILTRTLMEWDHEVMAVTNGTEVIRALSEEDAPALVILDWIMPVMDGLSACRFIRNMPKKNEYTYILILTGKTEKKDLLAAMDAGADDFLQKPFDKDQLRVRLRVAIRVLELQTSLIHKASYDMLTGLMNHGAILDQLNKELARSQREKKPVAVIVADLDHFKEINDTYGHQVGDSVLAEAARRMQSAIRCYDHLGRYGGEEFLIVLPGCSCADACRLANRVRNSIGFSPAQTSAGLVPFTISMGVASSWVLKNDSSSNIIHAADEALYVAKRNGRNRVEIASAELVIS